MRLRSTLTFAERYVTLDGVPFERSRFRAIEEPLRAMDNGMGKRVILLCSIQSFKTLALQLRLVRSMLLDPARSLWYLQQEDAVKEFMAEKLGGLLERVEPLQALRFDSRHKVTTQKVILPHAPYLFLSANIELNRNSKTARDLYIDEPWTYGPGQLTEIFGRTSSYAADERWRVMMATSGPTKGDETDQVWQDSTRHQWSAMCPGCGELVQTDWEHPEGRGMQWDRALSPTIDKPEADWSAIYRTVHYIMPCCGHRIDWAPGVLDQVNETARYVQTNPNPEPDTIGFRSWAWFHVPWPQLVRMRLLADLSRARGDSKPHEDFVRKRLARAYDLREEFDRSKVQKPFGGYGMKLEWDQEAQDSAGKPFRFLTVDVQRGHFWAVVRLWAPSGRSRLWWAGKLWSASAIEDLRIEAGIEPHRVFLDSGDQTNPTSVYRICAEYGWSCMNGVKPRDFGHRDGIRRIFDEPQAMDPFIGTGSQGRQFVAEVKWSSRSGKHRLDTLRQSIDDNGNPIWTVAEDAGRDYLDQIDNEVMEIVDRGGREILDFRTIGPNHCYDCEVMQVVCASMAGIVGAESVAEAAPKNEDEDEG